MPFVTDITTKEKFWNVWMDEDWYINLGRMHADGGKMKTEAADTLNTNLNTSQMITNQEVPGHTYFKDYFSLIFMYHDGEKNTSTSNRKKEHDSW